MKKLSFVFKGLKNISIKEITKGLCHYKLGKSALVGETVTLAMRSNIAR